MKENFCTAHRPTFFAAPRLDVAVDFFVVRAFALPASTFFGAGVFFAGAVLVVVAFFAATGFAAGVLDLVVVAFVVTAFAVAVFVALCFTEVVLGLAAGLFCNMHD